MAKFVRKEPYVIDAFQWDGSPVEGFEIYEDIPSFTDGVINRYLVKSGTFFKAPVGNWVVNIGDVYFPYDDKSFQENFEPGETQPIVKYLRNQLSNVELCLLELADHFGLCLCYECNKPGVFGWWWEYGKWGTPERKVMQGDYIADLSDCVENFFESVGFKGINYVPR